MADAQQRAEKEQQLNAEIAAIKAAEEEQLRGIEATEARLQTLEETRQQAEIQAQQRAIKEEQLNAELEALQAAEVAELRRIEEAEARVHAQQEANKRVEASAQEAVKLAESEKSIVASTDSEAAEQSWFVIDLERAEYEASERGIQPVASDPVIPDIVSDSTALNHEPAELIVELSPTFTGHAVASVASDDSTVPEELVERLSSEYSSERASALADLVRSSGDDSFELITKAFDDPASEVRNAAARALYDLQTDRAAAFTRALREGSPERRRRIGAAIAGSGRLTGLNENCGAPG